MVVWLSDVFIGRLAHQYTATKLKNNWLIPHINIATSNNTGWGIIVGTYF
jgi:hypothetical protein